MRSRVIAVCGTGTGVGKTRVSVALVSGARRAGLFSVGLKPIETGVVAGSVSDAEQLARASARPTLERYFESPDPVSPHLAARAVGRELSPERLAEWVNQRRAELTVVEAAGGLFSPISSTATNWDWIRALNASAVLVAPARLGVLHDVGASLRAARLEWSALVVSQVSEDEPADAHAAEIRGVVLPLAGQAAPVLTLPWVGEATSPGEGLWATFAAAAGFT